MINKKRVLMAYEPIYNGNIKEALKYYKEGKELALTYPIKGEIDMEMRLMDYILKMIN